MEEIKPLQIKDWDVSEQPREKLLARGANALTDTELIAILLGTGTANENALDIARKLLAFAENDLNRLADLPLKEMMQVRGLGKAKTIIIKAAMELGRRRKDSLLEKPKITGSKDAFLQLETELGNLPHEEFWVLLLNRATRVIRKKRISEGGLSGTVADPRVIFKLALDERATSIIAAHNHPSGNLTASQADIELTRKLVAAGKLLDIQVLDHIIIAGKNYCSFADSGLL